MPRTKNPLETKRRILDAATQVFVEKGFEQATILDIVAATDGLTRGAFYHHFKSKEEVLDEIAEQIFFDNNPFDALQQIEGLTGLEKIQHAVSNSIIDDIEPAQQELMRMTDKLLGNPEILSRQLKFNRHVAETYLAPVIQEGIDDGSIAPNNPLWLAELLMLLTNIWTHPLVSPASAEGTVEKLMLIGDIFDGIGFPLFNEDSIAAGEKLIELHFPEADAGKLKEAAGLE